MEQRFSAAVFLLTGGVLVWLAAFLAAYVFAAVVCARGFADQTVLGFAIVPAAAGASSLAALAGIAEIAAGALRRPSRQSGPSRAIRDVALVVCLLGATGVLWNALPAFLVAARC